MSGMGYVGWYGLFKWVVQVILGGTDYFWVIQIIFGWYEFIKDIFVQHSLEKKILQMLTKNQVFPLQMSLLFIFFYKNF